MSFLVDWLSNDAQDVVRLDRADFAFEFLRRDVRYVADHAAARAAPAGNPRAAAMDGLARRWGLCFPRRPEPPEP